MTKSQKFSIVAAILCILLQLSPLWWWNLGAIVTFGILIPWGIGYGNGIEGYIIYGIILLAFLAIPVLSLIFKKNSILFWANILLLLAILYTHINYLI